MSACTIAAIISVLGYMPPKGTVITVPRSAVSQLTYADQMKARLCARKYGIQYRIDEGK